MHLQAIIQDLDRYAPDQTVCVQSDTDVDPDSMAMIAWPAREGSDRLPGMTPLIDVWHAREVIAELKDADAATQTLAVIDAVRDGGTQRAIE